MRRALGRILLAMLLACTRGVEKTPALSLDTSVLLLGSDTLKITELDGAERRPAGLAISTLRAPQPDQLEMRYEVDDSMGRVIVTSRLTRDALLPIWQRHVYPTGSVVEVFFDSAGARIALRGSRGTVEQEQRIAFPFGTFSATTVDLVYRSLPLADGFATDISVYILGNAERIITPVRVVSSDGITVRGQSVECWHLEVEYSPEVVEHFWIAKSDRTIARIMGHRGPGIVQQYDR